MRVEVRAQKEGDQYVIECTDCGPLGVCAQADAVPTIKHHLINDHGITEIQETTEP